MTLTPDDLEPFMYVTVHSQRKRPMVHLRDPDGDFEPVIMRDELHDPLDQFGVPFMVLGLSLPYVICSEISPGGDEVGLIRFDIRKVKLIELDDSYVEAFMDFEDMTEDTGQHRGGTLGMDWKHHPRKGA